MAHTQDSAKGERLEPQVKKFYNKYIKVRRGGKQISATQTYHRRGLGAVPPAPGGYGGLGAKSPSRRAIFL